MVDAIELKTAPADFRVPTTNQTRHCFTRYIEFHGCLAAKGEESNQCEKFAKYYRSLCPGEWVEQIPLPLLFMRTVVQAIGAFPALILKYPKLWVGFLKCALLTKPQSFSVLLQLPPPQLENALNRTATLKAPLVAHASQQNIRNSLPRSVLAVLGLAPDTQSSNQAQTSQAHTGDTSNSEKDAAVTEIEGIIQC